MLERLLDDVHRVLAHEDLLAEPLRERPLDALARPLPRLAPLRSVPNALAAIELVAQHLAHRGRRPGRTPALLLRARPRRRRAIRVQAVCNRLDPVAARIA